MFGLGMPEILLILAIALIVIGPKRLPDLAKTLGRAMGEFKRATTDFKNSIDLDTGLDDIKSSSENVRRNIKEGNEAPKQDDKSDSQSKDSSADKAQTENRTYTDEQDSETFVSEEEATGGGEPADEKERKRNDHGPGSVNESNQAGSRAD